jgi:hypothetical protein
MDSREHAKLEALLLVKSRAWKIAEIGFQLKKLEDSGELGDNEKTIPLITALRGELHVCDKQCQDFDSIVFREVNQGV